MVSPVILAPLVEAIVRIGPPTPHPTSNARCPGCTDEVWYIEQISLAQYIVRRSVFLIVSIGTRPTSRCTHPGRWREHSATNRPAWVIRWDINELLSVFVQHGVRL